MDMFFFLIVEVFGCLHQQANDFLHQYTNMVWGTKTMEVFFFQFCVYFISKGVNGIITCISSFYFEIVFVIGAIHLG
jgi:hypothetical protein